MQRISLRYLRRRVQDVATALGAPQGDVWYNTADGRRMSRVDAIFLSEPHGGYQVSQIANENGGERTLSDIYTRRELDAWISGFLTAHYRNREYE